jgi:phosphoglycolate phosphatase
MQTVVAAYGYLGDDDRPESWQADGIITQPAQIVDWLDLRHAAAAASA